MMQKLFLTQAVGPNRPNHPLDMMAVHRRLTDIGKIPDSSSVAYFWKVQAIRKRLTDAGEILPLRSSNLLNLDYYKLKEAEVLDRIREVQVLDGIREVQRHFMLMPDEVVSPGGKTHMLLDAWKEKPINEGVRLPGRLKEAWDWVSPLLPEGSFCMSGYRSADEQRAILHKFYLVKYAAEIKIRYGQQKYDAVKSDLLANEQQVLEMVRSTKQQIAAPGKSMHQQGKAVDVGGPPAIDQKQREVIKLIASAHPDLFNGTVLLERNGCVHFEIK